MQSMPTVSPSKLNIDVRMIEKRTTAKGVVVSCLTRLCPVRSHPIAERLHLLSAVNEETAEGFTLPLGELGCRFLIQRLTR